MDVILEWEWPMTAGTTPKQADLWGGTAAVCEGRVGNQSIWAVLYREGDRLFGDELFADLFAEVGRRSVPPLIVATVMVLQRLQGLSDREAVEAFSFDARWKYACGGLPYDYPGFSHTVLVDMRARLAASARPERIFAVTVVRPGRLGWWGCGGCWIPPRCMTRSPRWTPSRCWARPSGGCSRWPRGGWRPSCAGARRRRRLRQPGQAADRLERPGGTSGAGGRAGPGCPWGAGGPPRPLAAHGGGPGRPAVGGRGGPGPGTGPMGASGSPARSPPTG